MLDQNTANGPACALATAYEQSGAIWEPSKGLEWNNLCERIKISGHCARHNEDNKDAVLKVLLWEPQHGHPNRGRPRTAYIDTIKVDTGLDNTKEIRHAILDQVVWKYFIKTARDDSRLM